MDRAADIAVLRARLAGPDASQEMRAALGHAPSDACLKGGILKGALHEVFPTAPGDEGAASGFAVALAARAAEGRRVLWLRTDFSALEHGEVAAPGLVELGLDPDRLLLLRAPDAASVLRGGLEALSCTALGSMVLEIPGTPKLLDLSASRRLVLTAAGSGVTAVLLRLDAQTEASAAETRWLVRSARSRAPHLAHAHISTVIPGERECICTRVREGEPGDWAAYSSAVIATSNGRISIGPAPGSPSRREPQAVRGAGDDKLWVRKTRGEGKDWGALRFEAELVRHRHGRTGQWVMEWNCDETLFAADAGAVSAAPADRPAQARRAERVA